MAAVGTMSYPSRDIFHGFPHHHNMDRSRTSDPLNGYSHSEFSYSSQARDYLYPHSRPYQSSSSPIFEDGYRPSLPPISNLLGIANTDRPAGRVADPLEAARQRRPEQQAAETEQRQQPSPSNYQPDHMNSFVQAQHNPYHRPERSSNQKLVIPPTPPFRGDNVLEGTQSPSTISTGSSLSTVQPYFLSSALSNVEASDQRNRDVPAQYIRRPSVPSQASTSPYKSSPYTTSPYANSPGGSAKTFNHSPSESTTHQRSGMYLQRPLPSNFPPPPPAPPLYAENRPTVLSSPNPWEHHHHYISSSSQATYLPPQDRYICPTCNKAFSRPSSLKIHSHSHTGEKPFKCPHLGCGKAFSVRSNMKRHEKGCHARPLGYFAAPASGFM